MNDKSYQCDDFNIYFNANNQPEMKCRKHFCICEDEYKWCNETNEKYQKAKKEGKAKNGKFFK